MSLYVIGSSTCVGFQSSVLRIRVLTCREQNQWRVRKHGRRAGILHGHYCRGFIDRVLQAQQGVGEATIMNNNEGGYVKNNALT